MRASVLLTLAVLALAVPVAASAQDILPATEAERLNRVLNDPGTDRRDGPVIVEADEAVGATLAVMDGDLELAGRVEGMVVVVNGSLALRPGAVVGGEVVVLGGEVRGVETAEIGGEVRVYPEPVAHCRRDALVDLTGRCAALPAAGPVEEVAWSAPAGPRDVRFLLATGRSYNRVEGLPVRFGVEFRTPGDLPLRLRAEGIYRTESGPRLGPSRWGYTLRAEQAVGRSGARAGGRLYSLVDPVEEWHVTDLENSLSTFFLRRDFRDHYEREGWSVYGALEPATEPWSAMLEVARERHRSLAAGSPWTLFDNALPWRPQPLVGEGVLASATARVRFDTRSEAWDPAAGWYVTAEVEQALESSLARPAYVRESAAGEPAVAVEEERFGRFTRVRVDVRRYNRISPSSRINLRAAGGGAVTRRALPPQRQHALGGEGTLPAYGLFALDCGVREHTGIRGGDPVEAGDAFHPGYGCDRFVLGQVEYRSDLSLRMRLPPRARPGEDESAPRDVRADISWILFADAGAGWSVGGRLGNERAALDVGTGIQWGDFGAYVALPVGARAGQGQANLFVRLAPRF